ncbi:MAG: glycosyl hydrolase [Gemmatimonadetes bacterium]|nr:glycosyl hydrolase [Gemmatimonadota bacterium]
MGQGIYGQGAVSAAHRLLRVLLLPFLLVALGGLVVQHGEAHAQGSVVYDPSLYQALRYRLVGPERGGRSTAVAGVSGERGTFYMGATGGGVWKTTDGGESWFNVSDGFFEAGSIGAVAVAESDPNVVYAGTGTACPRTIVSVGVGVYRSTDAGKSWQHAGLRDAGQIGRIRVHPTDPEVVYVAALGHIFGRNVERGVFRSKNGGRSWEKVLFISDSVGVFDLAMDPTNPRILYAAAWRVERKPWVIISGPGGGIYKTTDGGDTWVKLTNGLPDGPIGKVAVTVSAASPNRVWAIVEAEYRQGGVFRSDDGGASWRRVNGERRLLQRPWYYIHIFADPVDENTVYVLNTALYKSVDGGRTFPETLRGTHGDFHDLWLDPADPQVMITANDGGAAVSYNGGRSWSTQLNQPTAEIYRVAVDHQFPYRVYGAQQDNSTISLPSRELFGITPTEHWYSVAGCESGHIAVHPRDPRVVYGTCYRGLLERYDRATGERRNIMVYPEDGWGHAPRDLRYRFQWNSPVRVSPHDPSTIYHTSNYVHRSTDEGQTWEVVSPDLTRDDESKQDHGGGPITRDSGSNETYGDIFAFEVSPFEEGVLWAGSDDGLVHLSRDNGKTWRNVTSKGMPEWGTVNAIEVSAHGRGRAFIAVYRYKLDDFKPYIFRTTDYGESWQLLTDGTNGIPANHPVRVVREDPERQGLLYAGTEFGMFVSFDDGRRWQSLQLNLPVTPVTDLAVHEKELVVSTQGRSIWILDDLTPLHQLGAEVPSARAHLFKPRAAHRMAGGAGPAAGGAQIFYTLAEQPEGEATLEILDGSGKRVRRFTSKRSTDATGEEARLPAEAGLNRLEWDLRYPGPRVLPEIALRYELRGPAAVPGTYQVRLTVDGQSCTEELEVLKDPRLGTTPADFQAQFELLTEIRDALSQTHDAIRRIRDLRTQVSDLARRGGASDVSREAERITERLSAVEEDLTNPKIEAEQDGFNFTPKLDSQFTFMISLVVDGSDSKPTDSSYERFRELKTELAGHLERLEEVIRTDIASFNTLLRDKGLTGVIVPRRAS